MSNVLVQPAGRHAPYDQLLEADATDLLAQIAPLQGYEHITILQDIAQLVDHLAQTVQEQTEGLCCDVYRNLVQELSAYIKFLAWVLSIDHEFMSTEFYPNLTTFTSKAQDTVIVMQAKLSSGVLPQMDTHNEKQLNDYLGELRQSFVALDVIKVLDAARLFALELSPLSFKFLCTYPQISNVMMNQIQEYQGTEPWMRPKQVMSYAQGYI
ncbi:hypothetical protein EW026_g5236 [Hermanssonia centrifuga]|uniref:Uncharacterized protein n=1 Tax=Hermanssonia centrifuga TaxID=98765 RepID=A0A4S4KES4_9APHY|nr:hypothetical protein EW026_g5236 [Hermanssonia centrifuga]